MGSARDLSACLRHTNSKHLTAVLSSIVIDSVDRQVISLSLFHLMAL